MKTIALILSLLLLTSCSNPDTSGGVALSRGGGGDWDNTFPNGSCKGPDQFDNQGSKQVVVGCIPMRAVTTSLPAPTLKRGTV